MINSETCAGLSNKAQARQHVYLWRRRSGWPHAVRPLNLEIPLATEHLQLF